MASSHGGLIPLKTVYQKEWNCSERLRVRKILVTCIQLLLLQFLHLIWSMPTNFTFFNIFTHADVVNAQTWEVTPLKNPDEPP